MYKTYDNNIFGIGLLLHDIQKECEQNKQPRIEIRTEFFDDHCKSCGKQLELGKEFDYAGRTSCLNRKQSNEEFDYAGRTSCLNRKQSNEEFDDEMS